MKILIWDKDYKLEKVGGSTGYMYNIREYLKNNPNDHIKFYSDFFQSVSISGDIEKKNSFKNSFLSSTRLLRFISALRGYFIRRSLSEKEWNVIKDFDYVHVHNIFNFVSFFAEKPVDTKVILTMHYPELPIDEISSSFGYQRLFNRLPILKRFFVKKELEILNRADYLMFPVKEACEVYTNNSSDYKSFFDNNKDKIFYVPTAIYPSDKILSSGSFDIGKYSIDDGTLKICYIGRHNEVKGYDSLKQIAQETWKRYPNVYFIVGGQEGPLYGLSDKRWIELGWVNTFDVLNQIDVFVLPNKQTYFDLILLEVLRQGKTCLISNTGGNKWFSQFTERGIMMYDYSSPESVLPLIEKLISYKQKGQFPEIEEETRIFFKKHFTVEAYIAKYLSEVSKLS